MRRDADDLQVRVQEALEKKARLRARLSQSPVAPEAGDLYAFPATADDGIEWAVVLRHIDDAELWFAVPFDQNPLAGTWDVDTSELSENGPGTLRCGFGIWIRDHDFALGEKSGLLDECDLASVRDCLASMVTGQVTSTEFRHEIDDDPDYREWLDIVSHSAERLETSLMTPPAILSLAGARIDWRSVIGLAAERPKSLAADSGGLGSGRDDFPPPLPGLVIPAELSGSLVAVCEGNGIRLLYYPGEIELSPTIRVTTESTGSVISWRTLPDGTRESVEVLDVSRTPTICIQGRTRFRLLP